jgi:carbonic anhydrase/acetyltransferase-like protein (isoleucine patch superfamily)
MAIFQYADHTPRLGDNAWVADSATVLGRVNLGAGSSVWYGAVLRGDNDQITLGERCNVQDGAILHVDPGLPMVLGDGVSIAHQAMLHGCTIGDNTMIAIQAVVLNRARIGKNCVVAAGAVVTEGAEFPDGVLIMGAPAKVKRELTAEDIERNRRIADGYVEQAQRHRTQARRIA